MSRSNGFTWQGRTLVPAQSFVRRGYKEVSVQRICVPMPISCVGSMFLQDEEKDDDNDQDEETAANGAEGNSGSSSGNHQAADGDDGEGIKEKSDKELEEEFAAWQACYLSWRPHDDILSSAWLKNATRLTLQSCDGAFKFDAVRA